MDIRFCDWYIDSILGRVYTFKGYKVWLNNTYRYGTHSPVYVYSISFPDGRLISEVNLTEVNNIITKDYERSI